MVLRVLLVMFLVFGAASSAWGIIADSMVWRGSVPIRYLGIFDVYAIELYAAPGAESDEILSPEHSRCLKLDYARELTVGNFVEAAEQIMADQHPPTTLAAVRPEIDLLHRSYVPVVAGDSYTLCYDAATAATTLAHNGRSLVTIVSAEFADVYFGIWLDPESGIARELLADGRG